LKPEDYPGVKPLSSTSIIASTENFLLKMAEKGNRKKEGAPKIELWPNIDTQQYLPNQEQSTGVFTINNFFGACFKSKDIPDPRFQPVPLGIMKLNEIYEQPEHLKKKMKD